MAQHYRIYLEDLLNHYRDGDLTAKGALRMYFRIRLAETWQAKIKHKEVRQFFSKWNDKKGGYIEMAKSSYHGALHELEEEGEIAFKEPESSIIRLVRKSSRISDECPEFRTGIQNSEQVSDILDEHKLETLQGNGSSSSSDSFQISYKSSQCIEQNFQNFENTQEDDDEDEEEEQPGNSDQHGQIINVSVEQTKSSGLDQFSAGQADRTIKYDSRLGMRPPAPKPKYLIPDGDWLNKQGQLDPGFIRHTAKQWQQSQGASFHKLPIEEVEALVFSHFSKDHNSLVIKWEAYGKVSTRHAEAVKLRLDAGINIPESERVEIIGKSRAIASNYRKTIPLEQPRLTVGEEHLENRGAYQLIEAAPISEQEQIDNLKKLASLSSVIGRIPDFKGANRRSRNIKSAPSDINEANQWILDPALRMPALQWAKNNGFSFDGSMIYQEEF